MALDSDGEALLTTGNPQAPSRPWAETLRYLHWIFNPLQRLGVSDVYDLLATRSPGSRGMYLNLGYWEKASTLDDACDAMAELLAERCEMGPGDRVLDVGFGFADQDIYWMGTRGPKSIVGLNVTASQVEVARARVVELGLADRIDLRLGSATEMPLEDRSVDVVTALECAFHFDTRERFFAEAYRVLEPGGRLAVADILHMPPASGGLRRLRQRVSFGLVAGRFPIPRENRYTREDYERRLAACGFADVRVESIRDAVYEPMHRALAADPAPVERLHPVAKALARAALMLEPETLYCGLDYVLASARKPL
jgi:ubiquinone/menaquinone biosynthesis C-methylase UbiE